MRPRGLTLLIDADDTLWENNIYFEAVVEAFCSLIEARGGSRQAARDTLDAIERVRTKTNGYGVRNFHASLRAACREVLGEDNHQRELEELADRCQGIARQAIELLPDVRDTVRELSGRHRLILFTKGDLDDQIVKLHRSGLHPYFHQVDVVREKDAECYRDAAIRLGLRLDASWMIGNSPRSDILPALEAGLGAAFIPHARTWELEQGDVPAENGHRLLVLDRFASLTGHF